MTGAPSLLISAIPLFLRAGRSGENFGPLIYRNTEQRGVGRFGAMPAFIYCCPNTGFDVQGYSLGRTSDKNDPAYEAVICVACNGVHLVNARTGKVMGDEHRGFRRASSLLSNLAGDRRPGSSSKRLTWCISCQALKVWT